MSEVERRQAERDDYVVAVYELSKGNPLNWPNHQKIAETAGIPEADIVNVGMIAQGEGLIEFKTAGGPLGLVSITPRGIRRAEALILDPVMPASLATRP